MPRNTRPPIAVSVTNRSASALLPSAAAWTALAIVALLEISTNVIAAMYVRLNTAA